MRRVEYMIPFEAAVILTLWWCGHPWRSVLLLSIWAHIMENPWQDYLERLGWTGANARLWIAVQLQTAIQTFSLKFLVSSSQGKRALQILHGKPKPVLNYVLKCIFSCFTSGLQVLLLAACADADWKTFCVWYAQLASFLFPLQTSFDGEGNLEFNLGLNFGPSCAFH